MERKCTLQIYEILLSAALFAAGIISPSPLAGQSQGVGFLEGRVLDESQAAIPRAVLQVSDSQGKLRVVTANREGFFRARNLAPGRYLVLATALGFAPAEDVPVEIVAGRTRTLEITLEVAPVEEEVNVEEEQEGLSVEPDSNVGAIILGEEGLEAFSDDPEEEDLRAELEALAGPGAGPDRVEFYIDGFSGGQLPPKASIREIRINSDPFSAEYDRLGFGRIQILTKPGTGQFRGRASFGFSDESLNSRNPFAPNRPPYQSRLYGANLSGPVNKKSSFFIDFQRRQIDDNAVINATVLDPALNPIWFSEAVVTPSRRTNVGPRLDYQLSENHTLTSRYRYFRSGNENSGVGGFSLFDLAYDTVREGHTLQVSETAVLNDRTVNETRLQFTRNTSTQFGDIVLPLISVRESFRTGSNQVGRSGSRSNNWELHNITMNTQGKHAVKFGGRLRRGDYTNIAEQNFGGTFVFAGGLAPELDANSEIVLDGGGQPIMIQITSIERYRRTLILTDLALSPAEIFARGGGASQFTLSAGTPETRYNQTDLGIFVLDNWRVKPNFSLNMGLRYEIQSNIGDHRNWAPRLGFAWAPGAKKGGRSKIVIRGGTGIFYHRVQENLTLQALRFDGINQQQFFVPNPDFYPTVPSAETLADALIPPTLTQLAPNLRAPYSSQSAIGVERQLPGRSSVAATYRHTRGIRQLRSRNINVADPDTGIRPLGENYIFQYESSGLNRTHQMIVNFRTRFNRGVSLFGYYSLNRSNSNTDGAGTFPADPFDLSMENGPSRFDVRHRFVLGGSVTPLWGFRLSPFVILRSGQPFNITTGADDNGDLRFTDRPSFATDLNDPDVVVTEFGAFDPTPEPGSTIIPRNFGRGPSFSMLNLHLSKTFGFGKKTNEADNFRERIRQQRGGIALGGRGGGPRGGGGRGGFRGFGGRSNYRYSLSLSISARNVLNITNPSTPIGNLSSPFFGESNASSGFGRGRSSAGNRNISARLRFSF